MLRRNIAQGLLVFAVVFGPLAFGAVEPWSLAVLEAALFALLFVSPSRAAADGPAPSGLLPAALGILLIGLLQRLHPGPGPAAASFLPFTASARGTTQALLLWSAYASLLWGAPQALETRGAARRFAWALFLIGVLVALAGIAQSGQGNSAYYGLRPIRPDHNPFGPFTNRDHAASMMAMSAWMGCGLLLSRVKGLRERGEAGRLPDLVASGLLMLFLCSILLYGILQTGSRGAVNSLVVSAGIMSFLSAGLVKRRRWVWAARAGPLVLGSGWLLFICFHPYWLGISHGAPDPSVAYRLSMLRSGLRMFADFPWFGLGLGGAMAAFPAYQEASIADFVDHVHNDWLELLLQTGAVGLAIFAVGLAFFLRRAVKSWAAAPSLETRCLAGGALGAAAAFLAHGLAEFSFQIPANAALFFAYAAFLGTPGLWAGRRDPPPVRASPPRAAAAALSVLALALTALSARPAVASWYVHRSENAGPAEQTYLLARALQWDPDPRSSWRMAAAYLRLAETEPPARRVLLREALGYSAAAVRAEPLNPRFRGLHAAVLRGLGRDEDALLFSRPPA